MNQIEKEIKQLLSSEKRDELSRTMLDVIRVLATNNGISWKSELIQDLAVLREFKKEELVDKKILEKVLNTLKGKFIKIEEKTKSVARGSGACKDYLISLLDRRATMNVLSKDRFFSTYSYERVKEMIEVVKEDNK